jgi:hypothetical protein
MRAMPHANDEPLSLDDDQTTDLLVSCLAAWARGVDTYDMAKVASFRLGRVIPESFVANLLADYWEEDR